MTIRANGTAILIASKDEWKYVRAYYGRRILRAGPFKRFEVRIGGQRDRALFVCTGCGRLAAAAATQYVIDTWRPKLILNLGTCGGFKGLVKLSQILVVRQAAIYDAYEIAGRRLRRKVMHRTRLDLSGIAKPWPSDARAACIATGDQDLDPANIEVLRKSPFNAVAADWESAAIAWVAKRNRIRCVIVRGVSDEVGCQPTPDAVIREGARKVMKSLLDDLPAWLKSTRSCS